MLYYKCLDCGDEFYEGDIIFIDDEPCCPSCEYVVYDSCEVYEMKCNKCEEVFEGYREDACCPNCGSWDAEENY